MYSASHLTVTVVLYILIPCGTVGPCLEAFGYARILYGSSPSPFSHTKSNASDWYELARESFAELGTEQEGVDAVFFANAERVYGSS